MTIHGIYLKSRPKGKWHLVSLAISAEAANMENKNVLQNAQNQGYNNAEVAIKIFDSNVYIPELLSDIESQKPLYN